MKIKLFTVISLLLITYCMADTFAGNKNKADSTMYPGNLFTHADAEKILGENARLSDSTYEVNEDTLRYKIGYIADSADIKTGKTGAVYFVFEKYTKIVAAMEKYTSTYEANEDHDGIKVIHDIGDEAYSQVTKTFFFIMVRTRNKIIVMKVNKITSKTSLDEFMKIAKRISVTAYEKY